MINFDIFSSPVISVLGWAIVHSLWQGAIIGLMYSFLAVFVKHDRPEIKYNLSLISLFFVFFSFIITFVILFKQRIHTDLQTLTINREADAVFLTQSVNAATIVNNFSLMEQIIPFIVFIWFIGLLFFSVRIFQEFIIVQYVKKKNTRPINAKLQNTFNKIADRINLEKSFTVLESNCINVPMVIGYIKPVVLLPVGVFTGFSAQQIESIIAHELAHIYRKDFLINIFVSLIKPILFYHPVFWWLYSILQKERENCCDDIAVSVSNDPLNYAHALKKIYEFNLSSPSLAMAALKKEKHVFNRIKRITNKSIVESDKLGEILLLSLFIFGLLIFSAYAQSGLNFTDKETNSNISTNVSVDTVNAESTKTISDYNHSVKYNQNANRVEQYAVNENDEIVVIDSDLNKIETYKLKNLSKLDSVLKVHDSLMTRLDFNFQDFDVKFNSEKFDSLAEFLHFQFDSLHMNMDSLYINFDNIIQDFDFKMDSVEFKINLEEMKIDSTLLNLKLNFDFPDTLVLMKSLKDLDSLHIRLDSLNFEKLDMQLENMHIHLDSVLSRSLEKQKELVEIQSTILDPAVLMLINEKIEQNLKKVQLHNIELQKKLQKLNQDKLNKAFENPENQTLNGKEE